MSQTDKIVHIDDKSPEVLHSPELCLLRDRVHVWCTGKAALPKAAIRPEEIPVCLPNIAIVERRSEGLKRFFIRLTGEEITNRTLGYVMGRYIEDVSPAFYRHSLIKEYGRAIEQGEMKAQDIVWHYDHQELRVERLLVPLRMGGCDHATALLVATVRAPETIEYMKVPRHFDSADTA